ncbi:MAG: zinc/manganese transport system ATP-binding protein [Actinomycetota bacterium]|nr:zinc/manganese transport system ATP-binding protein [Actinomycetota bacterium]
MNRFTVELRAVTAAYGPSLVWTGLDLELEVGQFLVVLGGNGTGKTTLLRLLLGQLRPSAGQVRVLGASPRRGNPHIGYLAQQRSFDPDLPLRAQDLVRFGIDGHRWGAGLPSRHIRRRVQRALDSVSAADLADRSVGRLSGGQQQRIRIAQVLVTEPELILADEPSLSLDLPTQRQVMGLLDQRRRQTGTAVVVVSHDISPVLPYADRVLYLGPRGWVAGHPDEVLTTATLSRLHGTPVEVLKAHGRLLILDSSEAGHHLDSYGA